MRAAQEIGNGVKSESYQIKKMFDRNLELVYTNFEVSYS